MIFAVFIPINLNVFKTFSNVFMLTVHLLSCENLLFCFGKMSHVLFDLWNRQSTEALIMCEQDISRMRRQLDETNDELAQIARERDILAHDNDNLQEQFSKAKQENQVYLFLESFSPRKYLVPLRHGPPFVL